MSKARSRLRALVAGLTAGGLVVVLGLALGSAPASAAAPTQTLAEAVLHTSVRVVVTAIKVSNDQGAPTATARLDVYRRTAGGDWRLLGRRVIGQTGGWFWDVLTGPGSVCGFNLGENPTLRLSVSLALSPSIGCSPAYRYHLQNGRLITG
jgi:hypothetical protein